MRNRVLRIFSLILFSACLATWILLQYSNYLDERISMLKVDNIKYEYGTDIKDKGQILLQKCINDDELIMIGSSELGADVPQNPVNMFPNQDFQSNVNRVGRAHAQSLLDSLKLGSLDINKENKVVFVVSLQWFLDSDIDKKGTQSNFSELQFYRYINNSSIELTDRQYVCERLTRLLAGEPAVVRAYLYAKLYNSDNLFAKGLLNILKPYYWIRENFLSLKDKHDTYRYLKQENLIQKNILQIDWEKEKIRAYEMGREKCTNNDFYVNDEYYDRYLRNRIGTLKNSSEKVNLMNSKEFTDYELFLKTCKSKNIKPYIVFMSTNGYYYDYIGINKNKRDEFYNKLADITQQYGVDYLDLRDMEYEPYFYADVMHLGWRGWLYVNEQITKHFSEIDT